jgi:chaperone modulatory protein CbpM
MPQEKYIPAEIFCTHHQIDYSFIQSLSDNGLVQITLVEQRECIPENILPQIEKYVHLHYDLNINVEGIEAITHLLQRVEAMQDEIILLKNKLDLYR